MGVVAEDPTPPDVSGIALESLAAARVLVVGVDGGRNCKVGASGASSNIEDNLWIRYTARPPRTLLVRAMLRSNVEIMVMVSGEGLAVERGPCAGPAKAAEGGDAE